MGDCSNAEMRDALPELMFGELDAARRAEVQAHVDTCSDCSAELALIQSVRASARVPAVDVNRIVTALPAPRRKSFGFRPASLRMAAALALMIGGAAWYASQRPEVVAPPAPVQVAAQPSVTTTPSDVQEPATAARPAQQVNSATAPAARGLSLDGGLSDFSEAELQSLLASLDTFESNVVVEPANVLEPVIESEELR